MPKKRPRWECPFGAPRRVLTRQCLSDRCSHHHHHFDHQRQLSRHHRLRFSATGCSAPRTTRLQPRRLVRQLPSSRGRPERADDRLQLEAPTQIRPTRRDRPRAAVREPTVSAVSSPSVVPPSTSSSRSRSSLCAATSPSHRAGVGLQAGGRQEPQPAQGTAPARALPALVVDGWQPLNRQATNLLPALVSRRYERGSMIVTSNPHSSSWAEILGDAMVAAALIDQLSTPRQMVTLKGKSYRLREPGAPGSRLPPRLCATRLRMSGHRSKMAQPEALPGCPQPVRRTPTSRSPPPQDRSHPLTESWSLRRPKSDYSPPPLDSPDNVGATLPAAAARCLREQTRSSAGAQ
jgi:hypothetical protein